MSNVLRTIIVPATHASKGRQLGREVDVHGEGMFTTALSSDGLEPATHYVSSGMIDDQFASALSDGLMLHAAAVAGAKAQGIVKKATKADATGLPPASVVHDGFGPPDADGNRSPESPHELFARLNLKIVSFPLTP